MIESFYKIAVLQFNFPVVKEKKKKKKRNIHVDIG